MVHNTKVAAFIVANTMENENVTNFIVAVAFVFLSKWALVYAAVT